MSATDQQATIEAFLEAFKDDLAERIANKLSEATPDPNRLLTLAQVGERLGVGERAARNLTYSHHGAPPELASISVGLGGKSLRVEVAEVERFIEARRVAGKGTRR